MYAIVWDFTAAFVQERCRPQSSVAQCKNKTQSTKDRCVRGREARYKCRNAHVTTRNHASKHTIPSPVTLIKVINDFLSHSTESTLFYKALKQRYQTQSDEVITNKHPRDKVEMKILKTALNHIQTSSVFIVQMFSWQALRYKYKYHLIYIYIFFFTLPELTKLSLQDFNQSSDTSKLDFILRYWPLNNKVRVI